MTTSSIPCRAKIDFQCEIAQSEGNPRRIGLLDNANNNLQLTVAAFFLNEIDPYHFFFFLFLSESAKKLHVLLSLRFALFSEIKYLERSSFRIYDPRSASRNECR